jgi:hypothetical protein
VTGTDELLEEARVRVQVRLELAPQRRLLLLDLA